jgi:hypothetical protein
MTLGDGPGAGRLGCAERMGWAGRRGQASAPGQSGANELEDGGLGGTLGR